MITPPHSGECIHDPQWAGEWDSIIIAPGPLNPEYRFKSGTNCYLIETGYNSTSCYVCDYCTSRPEYFDDYLLYKLNQLQSIEEVVL